MWIVREIVEISCKMVDTGYSVKKLKRGGQIRGDERECGGGQLRSPLSNRIES